MSGASDDGHKSKFSNVGGLLVCGLAWGLLIGSVFSTPLYLKIPSLRSTFTDIEFCCLCIAITGAIGLGLGVWVDAIIRDPDKRTEIARKGWKLFAITFVLLAFLSGFWLPAVQ